MQIGNGEYQCKDCNSRTYTLNRNGPHIGLYCSNCGKWVMWIRKLTDAEGVKHIE